MIIFESVSFRPGIFKTTNEIRIVVLLFVTYNVHSNVRMAACCVDTMFKAQRAILIMSLKLISTSF